MTVILVLVVGLCAGWLANILIEGHGLGATGDVLFAIAGAFVATLIYTNIATINHSFSRTLFISIVGALFFLTPIAVFSTKPKRKSI